jgi:hypothetical protein
MSYTSLNLHDDRLHGMIALTGARVLLFFVDERGFRHQLLLTGVEELRADDFGLELFWGEDCTQDDVRQAMLWTEDLVRAEARPEPFVDAMLARIRRGEKKLLRMDPTLGCAFWAIVDDAVLDPPSFDWAMELPGTTRPAATGGS